MKTLEGRLLPIAVRSPVAAAILVSLFVFAPVLFAAGGAVSGGPATGGEAGYIVGFKPGIHAQDVSMLQSVNAKVQRRFHLVRAAAVKMSPQAAARLAANPRVAYVEPDIKVHATAQEVPWGVTRIGADVVHAGGNTGSPVKVAIIDTGIDYTHPDLAANYKGGYDFVNLDDDPMDDRGHGTHCAGTVAAVDNTEGVLGVAPGVWLYGLKMLDASGEGTLSDGIAAIEWCVDNGVQVASMSWGGASDPISEALRDACDAAYASGLVMVAAAGNDGPGTNTVNQPAILDSVIAVAAVDQTDSWAYFSSTGPAVELAAPGVGITSTWPGGGYDTYEGTSMACPHVSGVVALTIASGITGPDAIRQRLQQTAQDLGTPGRDEYFGYGLVRADWAAGGYDVIVTGITPRLGSNDEVVSATITGLGFQAGAIPHLTQSGQLPIFGTNVTVVSDTEITCDFSLLGAAGGGWDVAVTNLDSTSGLLPEGFYILGAVDEDFETGDFSRWSWQTSGDADWTVSNADSHTGTWAARAGSMASGGSSILEITLACGAGDISFFRKLHCPGGMLIFYVDGEAIGEWTGVSEWDTLPVEHTVAAGTHTFKWEYWDLLGDATGTIWLDNINFPPLSGEHNVVISTGASGTPNPAGPGGDVDCTVNAYDSLGHDLVYAWSAEGGAGSFDNSATRNPTWTAPMTPGDYDITVTVTCAQDDTKTATSTYTQTVSEFIVTGITPDSAVNDQVVGATITGLGFEAGATAQLVKAGQSPITGTGVTVVSATEITCSFNLVGAAEGLWNVVVTNPDAATATLYEGFNVVGAVDEDFETGDFSRWPWSTYGNADWTVSDAEARTGTYAARAGSMWTSGSSFLEVTVDCGAGDVSFFKKLSCAGGILIFYVDGTPIGEWYGITEWDSTPVEHTVSEGTHTFKWEYWDLVGDPPSTVWLDDINFPTASTQHIIAITSGPAGAPNPVASAGDVVCSVSATDSLGHALSYQWSADGGTFDDATLASPTWTAPANTTQSVAEYQISVTVTCVEDASINATDAYTQQVEPAEHTLSLTDAACGSVTVDGTPHELPWEGTFAHGASVEIVPVPDSGWALDRWSGDVPDESIRDNPLVVAMDQNRTINTHFRRDRRTLTIEWAAVGTVLVDGQAQELPCTVDVTAGETVTVEAVPDPGWEHQVWGGDVPESIKLDATIQLTMDQDRTIKPYYQRIRHKLRIEWAGAGTVRVNGTPQELPFEGAFIEGETVTVESVPNSGWEHQIWSGDVPDAIKLDATIQLTMDQDRTIKPYFQRIRHTLHIEWAGAGTVRVNGIPEELPFKGAFLEGETVTVEAVPNSGWTHQVWGGDVPDSIRLDATIQLTMDRDRTIKPYFQRIRYTLNVEWAGAGTVTVDGQPVELPWRGAFLEGQTVTVEAVPKEGWIHQVWGGDVPESIKFDANIQLTMDRDRTIKPYFMRERRTLTVEDAAAGSVLINGEPHELPFTGEFLLGSTVIVDAVPDPGMEFDQWSGDYPEGERFSDPLELVMDRDYTIDPHFRRASTTAQLTSMSALPAGRGAQICFTLSSSASVTAEVMNIAGRTVKHLVTDRLCDAGLQSLAWNRMSDYGTRVPSGTYLVRVTAYSADGQRAERLATLQVR